MSVILRENKKIILLDNNAVNHKLKKMLNHEKNKVIILSELNKKHEDKATKWSIAANKYSDKFKQTLKNLYIKCCEQRKLRKQLNEALENSQKIEKNCDILNNQLIKTSDHVNKIHIKIEDITITVNTLISKFNKKSLEVKEYNEVLEFKAKIKDQLLELELKLYYYKANFCSELK